MADVFPLRKHVPIGVDSQGKPILPSTDFIKQWEELFRRVGQYTALTNTELETALAGAEDAANAWPPDIPQIEQDDTAPPGAFFTPDTPTDARIEALEAAVQTLASEIEALKQGLYA